MNPEQQQQLLNKLQKQAGLQTGMQSGMSNQSDTVTMGDTSHIQLLDSMQNEYIKSTGQQFEPIKKPNFQQNQQPVQQSVQQSVQQPVQQSDVSSSSKSLRDRIDAIEQELGESSQTISTVTARAKVYLDEYGNETFYAENISNGHIVISDLDITIPRGKSVDLLKSGVLDDLKKSRDLRAMLAGDTDRPMLQRLTPEEYFIKRQTELSNKRKVEQLRTQSIQQAQFQQQQNSQNMQNPQFQNQQFQNTQSVSKIRPTVLSKLEKLRLSTVPENSHLGLTHIEFVSWALTEKLTGEELDFITTHPNVVNNNNSNEIRQALFEKRSRI